LEKKDKVREEMLSQKPLSKPSVQRHQDKRLNKKGGAVAGEEVVEKMKGVGHEG